MGQQLVFDLARVLAFVRQQVPLPFSEGMAAIGQQRDGQLIAGAVFEGYSGPNIWVHLAGRPGGHWLTRRFIAACMRYAFVVCGCQRLSAYVMDSNAPCKRFIGHFGFRLEARLRGAASDGGDLLIYVLTKQECRYAFE